MPKSAAKAKAREKEKLRLLSALRHKCEEMKVALSYIDSLGAGKVLSGDDMLRMNFARQEMLKKTFDSKKLIRFMMENGKP